MDTNMENTFAAFKVKERSVNFQPEELSALQNLVDKYKHILLNKKTDGTSSKQKEATWLKIATEFNAFNTQHRTAKQLKFKFENMKRKAKKEACMERQERRKTGGGPPPPPAPPTEEGDWLRSVMPVAIGGLEATYDDDVLEDKTKLADTEFWGDQLVTKPEDDTIMIKEGPGTQNISEAVIMLNSAAVTNSEYAEGLGLKETPQEVITLIPEPEEFDCSYPKGFLRKPMSAQLKVTPKRRRVTTEDVQNNFLALTSARKAVQEKKSASLSSMTAIQLEIKEDKLKNQKELHAQQMRYNEERHALEMDILKLKKKKLEAEVYPN